MRKTGCYKDVLVIAEGSTEEGPDAEQLKYHAPAVGFVRSCRVERQTREEPRNARADQDRDARREGLAEARAEALEIEKRAYIYGRTAPAELRPLAQTQ